MADESARSDALEEQTATPEPRPQTSHLPFIITLVALLLYFGFQTVQLIIERGNLGMMKNSQDAALQEAQKVQEQFRNLVTKTNQLAEQGHAGAKMVMEELQRQGLGAPATQTAPPSKAVPKPAK